MQSGRWTDWFVVLLCFGFLLIVAGFFFSVYWICWVGVVVLLVSGLTYEV